MAIRISTDFGSLTNNKLWNRGMAVFLALTGSVKYSNPPMAMAMLKSLLDAFHEAIVEAMDGGKMARTTRDSLRAQVITALNHLGHTSRRTVTAILATRVLKATIRRHHESPHSWSPPRLFAGSITASNPAKSCF